MSRRSQPYRRGLNRQASAVLATMKRGRPVHGPHPMDMHRQMLKRRRQYTR